MVVVTGTGFLEDSLGKVFLEDTVFVAHRMDKAIEWDIAAVAGMVEAGKHEDMKDNLDILVGEKSLGI